jgi:1-acyl-sn-glycerol-3-phosphate acyltransferase
MVQKTSPKEVGEFQRGFAHLALRTEKLTSTQPSMQNLAVLPVAIAALEESVYPALPLQFLRIFDPSEPLFDQMGWHPLVIYHRVKVVIGHPYWVTPLQQQQYRSKQGKEAVQELTHHCQSTIAHLLKQECA